MSRTARTVMFAAAGGAVAVFAVLAVVRLPAFGSPYHPYRDHAFLAGVAHDTANLVSSVNFDQRGLDTLGEETILLASVMGVSVLLRRAEDEEEHDDRSVGWVLDATRLGGYIILPVTVLVGFDVITHGHLTPGGGFQGGVVVGTGIHLMYVAGRYRSLERMRPTTPFEWGEAVGAGAFAAMGVAGLLVSGAFLANLISYTGFGQLFSSGTVALLNGAVGIEVASGVMVLLAKFLEQAIVLRRREDGEK
ncbi:MAG TPA: MnhB domain-containing protein [Acidimicrobiales bacterium]|nr:MnhB domain-containing protein [Acidimicrobiales bacterium]